MSNVHLEKWSTAGGRGGAIPSWEIKGYSGAMVEPTYMPLIGYPQAWSGSTNGAVTGEVVIAQIQTPADLDKWHGKLKGKIVFLVEPLDLPFPTTPLAHRYTDEELAALVPEILPTGGAGGRGGRGGRGGAAALGDNDSGRAAGVSRKSSAPSWLDEGVLATVTAIGARRKRHGVRQQRFASHRRSDQESAVGRDHRGELQPHRAPAGAQRSGEAVLRYQDAVRYLATPTRST